MKTLQTIFIEHLTKNGYTEQTAKTNKYRKLTKGESTLWIGKRGAIRSGQTVQSSRPLPTRVYEALKQTATKKGV